MSEIEPLVQAERRRGLRSLWPGAERRRQTTSHDGRGPESLFGALVGGDSQVHDDEDLSRGAGSTEPDRESETRHAPSSAQRGAARASADTSRSVDERVSTAAARAYATHEDAARAEPAEPFRDPRAATQAAVFDTTSTTQRLFKIFVGARAVLGAALVAALVAAGMLGMRAPLVMMLVAMAYTTQAVVLWMLPRFRDEPRVHDRLTRGQWIATIGVDLVMFSWLHWMQPTQNFNLLALLLLPVLMGGVLAPRRVALAGSSAVVLIVLAVTWTTISLGGDAATLWMQAGLAGAGFFAVTLLAGEMSTRLASQDLAARSGLELARQQAQLNRLVIEEMTDGVLVVDGRTRVRAANPAARRLLVRDGLGRAAPFQLQGESAWADLESMVRQAFAKKSWPAGETNATLKFPDGMTRTLRVRARFTRRRAPLLQNSFGEATLTEVFCVLFLEDQRLVHDRTRQEKLAAMGRVSAGIAHEIRNPLAAIAQANALLREDAQGRDQQMLTRMVHENVERLKLIVDDVMAVAPSADATLQRIDAVAVVGHIVGEWSRASDLPVGAQTRLRVEIADAELTVVFDPEHLRRVLVNLLDNARRHATDSPGAITLQLSQQSPEHVMLSVASDGEPIGPDIEPYLFEPFFSSRSRGTGLGLYICRELCERYGATIDYWQHPVDSRHRNQFRVVFRTADRSEFSESRLLS